MDPEDQQIFMETANRFLEPANDLVGAQPLEEIAAAFLFACALYSSFAMQAQVENPGDVGDEAIEMLRGYFAQELQTHMGGALSASGASVEIQTPIAIVSRIITDLRLRPDAEQREFYDLGDRFIDVANSLRPAQKVSRISACMMHACTRFNVFVLQRRGHPPASVDETLVETLCATYADLLGEHLREINFKPTA